MSPQDKTTDEDNVVKNDSNSTSIPISFGDDQAENLTGEAESLAVGVSADDAELEKKLEEIESEEPAVSTDSIDISEPNQEPEANEYTEHNDQPESNVQSESNVQPESNIQSEANVQPEPYSQDEPQTIEATPIAAAQLTDSLNQHHGLTSESKDFFKPAKKRISPFIIILVIIVILGGGMVAGYYIMDYVQNSNNATNQAESANGADQPAGDSSQSGQVENTPDGIQQEIDSIQSSVNELDESALDDSTISDDTLYE